MSDICNKLLKISTLRVTGVSLSRTVVGDTLRRKFSILIKKQIFIAIKVSDTGKKSEPITSAFRGLGAKHSPQSFLKLHPPKYLPNRHPQTNRDIQRVLCTILRYFNTSVYDFHDLFTHAFYFISKNQSNFIFRRI